MPKYRLIKLRVYHCSADEEGVDHPIEYYDDLHRKRGFKMIGYNFIIHPDGNIEIGRPLWMIPAQARGHNKYAVGICYIGGLKNGNPCDTRTYEQKHAMRALDSVLESMYPDSERLGHRDLSVDLNGDGVITQNEWMKACPSFDAVNDF